MNRIKKGDTVMVIAGKDKGKKGEVTLVTPKDNTAIVAGVNVITRHTRPSMANPQGGRVQKEAPIDMSKLMPVDPTSGKPTRVGVTTLADGKRVRVAKTSGEQLDK
ncbi:50S ribosomal protein L24 [compost metagenome]|nr:50S ribosomal protein L24 [bacterium]